jgi:hypothetical protein
LSNSTLIGAFGALGLQHRDSPSRAYITACPSWPGLSRPSTAYGVAKNVDARDICAKTRFALLPGHDDTNGADLT